MSEGPSDANIAEMTANMLSGRSAGDELSCAYNALDRLMHEKLRRQHRPDETISICYETQAGGVRFIKVRHTTPGEVQVSLEGGPGKHRAPEIITGYIGRAMTLHEAGSTLSAAQVIEEGLEMIDSRQGHAMLLPLMLED
ncbi:MAG TPA: hypothetical protein VGE30_01365 [Candidatus Saccharimonadales bacterium]